MVKTTKIVEVSINVKGSTHFQGTCMCDNVICQREKYFIYLERMDWNEIGNI